MITLDDSCWVTKFQCCNAKFLITLQESFFILYDTLSIPSCSFSKLRMIG